MAEPLFTVPSLTSLEVASSIISKFALLFSTSGTILKAADLLLFFASYRLLIKGTSAPHPGPSQIIVLAQRYAIGVAPSGSFG